MYVSDFCLDLLHGSYHNFADKVPRACGHMHTHLPQPHTHQRRLLLLGFKERNHLWSPRVFCIDVLRQLLHVLACTKTRCNVSTRNRLPTKGTADSGGRAWRQQQAGLAAPASSSDDTPAPKLSSNRAASGRPKPAVRCIGVYSLIESSRSDGGRLEVMERGQSGGGRQEGKVTSGCFRDQKCLHGLEVALGGRKVQSGLPVGRPDVEVGTCAQRQWRNRTRG